jgi:uncharacterized protein YndB with AHSA1/START domain
MSDTRSFDITIEIAVSPDAVWQAITDPAEITRWFASRAEVVPGAGGKWMISWDGNWPWNADIEIWEPNRRLRLVDRNARPYDVHGEAQIGSAPPMQLAIDWHIEAKGGTTTLRLVHSGFGRGGAWDDEFEGVSVGWPMELHGLKHYLEQHRGERREVAWNRVAVAAPPETIWPRLVGPEGIMRDARLLSLRPGDPYETTLSTGDRISGTVVRRIGDRGFQVTVDRWNGALYRLWVDRVGGESAVNSWLSAYGVPADVVRDFNARMSAELDRVAAAVVAGAAN